MPVPFWDEPLTVKHPSSRLLYDYWITRRGCRVAPEPGDIEPTAIPKLMGDSFVLSGDEDRRFRVAGTRVCALFGRLLRGQPFMSIWQADCSETVRAMLLGMVEEETGVVAGAATQSPADAPLRIELLLLPLVHRCVVGGRILGLLVAWDRPDWLGLLPAAPLRLDALRYLDGEAGMPPRLLHKLAARQNFTVIDGGRS
jgi:hypothetical protein